MEHANERWACNLAACSWGLHFGVDMVVCCNAWAYRNVQLEHIMELKSAAIRANLAWPDGSFFAKTEIKSKKERDAELSIERAANAESIREMSPAQNWRNYVWTTIIIALIIILSKLIR